MPTLGHVRGRGTQAQRSGRDGAKRKVSGGEQPALGGKKKEDDLKSLGLFRVDLFHLVFSAMGTSDFLGNDTCCAEIRPFDNHVDAAAFSILYYLEGYFFIGVGCPSDTLDDT